MNGDKKHPPVISSLLCSFSSLNPLLFSKFSSLLFFPDLLIYTGFRNPAPPHDLLHFSICSRSGIRARNFQKSAVLAKLKTLQYSQNSQTQTFSVAEPLRGPSGFRGRNVTGMLNRTIPCSKKHSLRSISTY